MSDFEDLYKDGKSIEKIIAIEKHLHIERKIPVPKKEMPMREWQDNEKNKSKTAKRRFFKADS